MGIRSLCTGITDCHGRRCRPRNDIVNATSTAVGDDVRKKMPSVELPQRAKLFLITYAAGASVYWDWVICRGFANALLTDSTMMSFSAWVNT